MKANRLHILMEKLDYSFKNIALLQQALTHRSADAHNNERLEFLGDSLLNTIIANALFHRFPQKNEGELSRLRAHLVKGDTLAKLAQTLDLGNFLYLGQGELKSGGYRRASILADALEAVFAGIFLDSDFITCERILLQLFSEHLKQECLEENLKDPKTQLQEFLQAKKILLPHYQLTKVEGEMHDQIFYVTCTVKTLNLHAEGKGTTRRKAEQEAAKNVFCQLR